MIALRWNIAQSFERLWWRNYLSRKDKNGYLEWKKNYWDSILQQVFDLIGNEDLRATFRNQKLQILDAGCGPAGIFLNLENHRVDAVDPLVDQYLDEQQLIKRADYPNVRFVREKLENYSKTETYDYVFCMNCINHVNDIELCIDNLITSLKQKGVLVLSVDAHKYRLIRRFLSAVPADILHPYQFFVSDYYELLESQTGTIAKTSLVKEGLLFDLHLLVVQKGLKVG